MAKDPLVSRSKHLSKILRHDPGSVGLSLDGAGWVQVSKLLTAVGWTKDDLDKIVADNNKKRFEYDETGTQIRASQGHSVDVDLGYKPQTPPEYLFHGTPRSAVEAILREGLRPMTRIHVHLSHDTATALVVAKRRPGESVILKVAAGTMAAAGHPFYLSTNGVWLAETVPPQYISPV